VVKEQFSFSKIDYGAANYYLLHRFSFEENNIHFKSLKNFGKPKFDK
jgi:hypothetical protein